MYGGGDSKKIKKKYLRNKYMNGPLHIVLFEVIVPRNPNVQKKTPIPNFTYSGKLKQMKQRSSFILNLI